MNKIEIINSVYNSIIAHKHEAEQQADINYYKLTCNEEFNQIDKEIRALIIEIAQAEFTRMPTDELCNKKKLLEQKRLKFLEKFGLTENYLKPHYNCLKCNDTGFIENEQCSCFKTKLAEKLLKYSNIHNKRTIKDFNTTKYENELGTKLLKFGQKIVEKQGILESPIVVIRGEVGVGKTYYLECLSGELIKAGVAVVMMSAFELSQKLLEWHMGIIEEKSIIQNFLVDAEVLIIDDLGTEPIYKNVSIEYLQNIIDIRLTKQKLTIISTNLMPNDFINRYGDRISSRVIINNNNIKIEINSKDLRTMKNN